MTSLKANCILLNVRGKYYYAEEFEKFIEIEEWEYHRILNNPYLYSFSTALKKHFEWCAAVGKSKTLTFLEALGQTHSASGSPGDSLSAGEPNEAIVEFGNDTRKPVAVFLSTLCKPIERSTTRLTKWTISALALVALIALLGGHSPAPPKHPPDIAVAQSPEIRRAIPVEPESRRAIPVEPEIRKAIPVHAPGGRVVSEGNPSFTSGITGPTRERRSESPFFTSAPWAIGRLKLMPLQSNSARDSTGYGSTRNSATSRK